MMSLVNKEYPVLLLSDILQLAHRLSGNIFICFKGNEIEWKHPKSVDLTGVEFKALASGSHTITKDFM